jgi:WbqC-like protein family
MKLGIMQPYFFPYLGYFDLINYTDKWIVFDNVQYIRHGWINRNRILHPTDGWTYIIVPVNHTREMCIRDVTIAEGKKWKKRILGQLQNYKKAPYYDRVMDLMEDCLALDENRISYFNVVALRNVCAYLGIHFDYAIFSEMNLDLENIQEPGDWALRISQAVGADEYVNPPGGEALFNKESFAASNIKLTIRNLPPLIYDCPGYTFIPNLSIIDVLMWNPVETIRNYLDEHRNEG